MKKLFLPLITLLLLSGGASAQARKWQTFSSANGDWTILSPGVMQPDDDARKTPSKKGAYSFKDFDGFFAVAYRDLSKRLKGRKLKNYLDKTRDGAVKGFNGRLMRDEEFTNGGITGREIFIKADDRIERARLFFHGRRFYVVIAVLPQDEINAAEIDAYMKSFTVKDAAASKR